MQHDQGIFNVLRCGFCFEWPRCVHAPITPVPVSLTLPFAPPRLTPAAHHRRRRRRSVSASKQCARRSRSSSTTWSRSTARTSTTAIWRCCATSWRRRATWWRSRGTASTGRTRARSLAAPSRRRYVVQQPTTGSDGGIIIT